jgi:O-antigen ligase
MNGFELAVGRPPGSDPSRPWWAPHSDEVATPRQDSRPGGEPKAAFVSLVAFTFILLLSPQNFFPVLSHFRIALLVAGVTISVVLWDRWRQRKPLLNLGRELLIATTLVMWALMTLPLSYWPGGSIRVISGDYLKAIVIFWLLANVITTPQRLRFVAISLMLCSIPLAVAVLKNFFSGQYLADTHRIQGYPSSLGNPNDVAFMLNLTLPLSTAIFLSVERPFVRALCLSVMGISVLGVILTFSRSGFVGLAAIGLVYFFKLAGRDSDRRWAFAALALALVFAPFLPATYVERLSTIGNIDADTTGSAQARWRDNFAALEFINRHPIVGCGIGQSALALNSVRGVQWTEIHNVYLEHAVDLGLPGLALFLALLYAVFRAARGARRRAAHVAALRDLFLLNEGIEVSLIVFIMQGFFHPVAYNYYFYYIAGVAVATRFVTDFAMSGQPSAPESAALRPLAGAAYELP